MHYVLHDAIECVNCLFSLSAGSDFNGTVMNLTFSSSVRHNVVKVPIVQDSLIEGTEQFRAILSLVESNGINVDLSPEQAIVNITDEKGMAK